MTTREDKFLTELDTASSLDDDDEILISKTSEPEINKKTKKISARNLPAGMGGRQAQADLVEGDPNSPSFILHKDRFRPSPGTVDADALDADTQAKISAFLRAMGVIDALRNLGDLQSITVATASSFESDLNAQRTAATPLEIVISADINGTYSGSPYSYRAGDVLYVAPMSDAIEQRFNIGGGSGAPVSDATFTAPRTITKGLFTQEIYDAIHAQLGINPEHVSDAGAFRLFLGTQARAFAGLWMTGTGNFSVTIDTVVYDVKVGDLWYVPSYSSLARLVYRRRNPASIRIEPPSIAAPADLDGDYVLFLGTPDYKNTEVDQLEIWFKDEAVHSVSNFKPEDGPFVIPFNVSTSEETQVGLTNTDDYIRVLAVYRKSGQYVGQDTTVMGVKNQVLAGELTARERAGLMSISISPNTIPDASAGAIKRDYILTITGSDVLPVGTWYRIVIHGENFPRLAWVRSPGVQRLRFSISTAQANRIAAQIAALHDMTVEIQLWDAETAGNHYASRVETVGLSGGSSGDVSGKQDKLDSQQLAELIDVRLNPSAIVPSAATIKGTWEVSSDDPSVLGASVWATLSIAGQSPDRQRLTGSVLRFNLSDAQSRQIDNNIPAGATTLNVNVLLYDAESAGNLLANLHRDVTLLPSGRAEDDTARMAAAAAAAKADANKVLIDANAAAIKSNREQLAEGVGILKRAEVLPEPTDANADDVYYVGKTIYINDEVGKSAVFRNINATDLRAVWANAVSWGGIVGSARGATTTGRVVFVTEAAGLYDANTWQIANNGGWELLPSNANFQARWRGRVQDEAHAVDAVSAVNQWVSWGNLMQVTTSVGAATHREWHRYERNEVQAISVATLATSVIPVNVDLGAVIEITVDRDITLSLSGGNNGDDAIVSVIQDATGSHDVSYGGANLDLSTDGGAIDSIAFLRRGGSWVQFGKVIKDSI